MGVSAAVTMDTGMFIFCACANAQFTAVYQLSGWIKVWFILFDYPVYSCSYLAWQEQRGPDNRGSTVQLHFAHVHHTKGTYSVHVHVQYGTPNPPKFLLTKIALMIELLLDSLLDLLNEAEIE